MEIDLLKNNPRPKRNLDKRLSDKSPEVVKVAREFGEQFFDGDRKFGYGGFGYNAKYWENVVKDFVEHYNLPSNAKKLEFEDNYFDLVISINTIHNLELDDCLSSIKEISRVSKVNSFLTVDAFRSDEEKERMFKWNLTAKTIMSVSDWKETFKKIGYDGDFYWFIPYSKD